jgi:hypothetical protein
MQFQYRDGQVTFEVAIQNHRDVTLEELLGKIGENSLILKSGENVQNYVCKGLFTIISSISPGRPMSVVHLSELTIGDLLDIKGFGPATVKGIYQLFAANAKQQSSEIIVSEAKDNTPVIQTQVNIPFANYLGHYKSDQITFDYAWSNQLTQPLGELLGKIKQNPKYISTRELSKSAHIKLQNYLSLYSYDTDQNFDVLEGITITDLSFYRPFNLQELEEIYEAYAKYATP